MTRQNKKTAKRNPKVKRKPSKAGTVLYLRKWPILRPFSYTKLMYEYNMCHEGLAFNKSNNGVIFNHTHTHIWSLLPCYFAKLPSPLHPVDYSNHLQASHKFLIFWAVQGPSFF